MDSTESNAEEGQDAPLAPEISDWEPSAPPEDGSPPDYYTAMKLSDVPSDIPPPPEYSPPSIQGMWTGEIIQESTVSSLAYADFLPRCLKSGTSVHAPVFDNFKSLIDFANHWLRNNRKYKVLRCESITRKIKDGQIEMESTAFHQSLFGENDYVRGLRIWLIPAESTENEEPQEIAYLNIVPKDIKPKMIPFYMTSVGVGAFGMSGAPMAMGTMKFVPIMFPDFEDLQKTCERFNSWVRQYPLPGKMLNLESLHMIHSEAWTSRCLDPDEGFFRERGNRSKLYITVLRLFYVLGKPLHEELGFEDFNPEIVFVSKVRGAKPRYEPYTTVLQKAGTWIYNQNLQKVRVMNMNSIDTKVDSNEFRRLSDRFRIDSKESFHSDLSYKNLTFVKTIRVCYARTASMKISQDDGPVTLTSKCMIAARLRGNNLTESLSSLVQRINAWINHTRVKVIGVETVKFEYNKGSRSQPINDEKSDYTVESNRGHHWIIGLRLYIDGQFEEPPPELLPPPPEQTRNKSSGCLIL